MEGSNTLNSVYTAEIPQEEEEEEEEEEDFVVFYRYRHVVSM